MALYSFRHIFIILIFVLLPLLWALNFKKTQKIIKYYIIILVILEIIRISGMIIIDDFNINKDLSLQLCYTYIFIGIIYLKNKKNYFLSYLGAFGFLFGFLAIIFRNPNPFLNFETIISYIQHAAMISFGFYIIKNYKINYSFKCTLLIWIQIIIGILGNILIRNGSNYIFMNSIIFPSYHLDYSVNVEIFNLPILKGYSINSMLTSLINNVGHFYYIILLIIIINIFLSLWLFFVDKRLSRII